MALTKEVFNTIISALVAACNEHAMTLVRDPSVKIQNILRIRIQHCSIGLNNYLINLRELYSPQPLPSIYEDIYKEWVSSTSTRYILCDDRSQNFSRSVDLLPFALNQIALKLNADYGTNFSLEECDFLNRNPFFSINYAVFDKNSSLKESCFLNQNQELVIQFSFENTLSFLGQMINHASEIDGAAFLALMCACVLFCSLSSSPVMASIAATGAALSAVGFFVTIRTPQADGGDHNVHSEMVTNL